MNNKPPMTTKRVLHDKASIDASNSDLVLSHLADYSKPPLPPPSLAPLNLSFEIFHNITVLLVIYLISLKNENAILTGPYLFFLPFSLCFKMQNVRMLSQIPRLFILIICYTVMIPGLQILTFWFPQTIRGAIILISALAFLLTFNYNYFFHKKEIKINILNINTSFMFAHMYTLMLISNIPILSALITMLCTNLLVAYSNISRKLLYERLPWLYYLTIAAFGGYVIYAVSFHSYFAAICRVQGAILVIITSCSFAFFDKIRVRMEGPFVTPTIFNYGFETLHVLKEKLDKLKMLFGDELTITTD